MSVICAHKVDLGKDTPRIDLPPKHLCPMYTKPFLNSCPTHLWSHTNRQQQQAGVLSGDDAADGAPAMPASYRRRRRSGQFLTFMPIWAGGEGGNAQKADPFLAFVSCSVKVIFLCVDGCVPRPTKGVIDVRVFAPHCHKSAGTFCAASVHLLFKVVGAI